MASVRRPFFDFFGYRPAVWVGLAMLTICTGNRSTAGLATPASESQPKVIVDVLGNVFALSATPQRVVSTCLTCDEIILGILDQAGKRDRLIAISKISDDPRYSNISNETAAIKQRAGSEIESVISMRPDVVFITEFNRPEFRSALLKAKVPSFALGPFNNLKDVLSAIESAGLVLGEPVAAAEIKNKLIADLELVRSKVPKNIRSNPTLAPTVLSFSADGTIAAAETPFDGIVRAAGAANLAAIKELKGWPRISLETIATWTPDWIVAGGTEATRPQIVDGIKKAIGWKNIPAVKDGRIIIVPEALLLSTSHHVAKTVAVINAQIFPSIPEEKAPSSRKKKGDKPKPDKEAKKEAKKENFSGKRDQ